MLVWHNILSNRTITESERYGHFLLPKLVIDMAVDKNMRTQIGFRVTQKMAVSHLGRWTWTSKKQRREQHMSNNYKSGVEPRYNLR